jgi:hypothetical protein
MSATTTWAWDKDLLLNIVVPAKDLFRPEFECIEQREVCPIGKGEFFFTEIDETVHGVLVVPNTRIGYESIDSVHLHLDLSIDRYFATYYGISETAVIDRSGRIR